MYILKRKGFPDGSAGKESACNAEDPGDVGLIPGMGRSPGGGNGKPLQYSCLKKAHGQRSLAGYNQKGLRVGHDWATKHSTAHSKREWKYIRSAEFWSTYFVNMS